MRTCFQNRVRPNIEGAEATGWSIITLDGRGACVDPNLMRGRDPVLPVLQKVITRDPV